MLHIANQRGGLGALEFRVAGRVMGMAVVGEMKKAEPRRRDKDQETAYAGNSRVEE